MKKGFRLLLLLLILVSVQFHQPSQAQSIHKEEYELFGVQEKQPSLFSDNDEIIKFNKLKSSPLRKAVFGYLPYWEYPESKQYLQYDLLSHIALFDFSLAANGDISFPSFWPWTDVINEAHLNGTKVIMTIVNFNTAQLHTILTTESTKTNFFEQALAIIQEYDLQGINVDFEGLALTDRGVLLNDFMKDLTTYLHSEMPGCEVSFAAPPVNWGGWDLHGLAESCDYLFIMGYNYYGSWSATSGPGAPLAGGNINITKTVTNDYGEVIAEFPEKLILGVPYYGNKWQTANTRPYSTAVDHISHPRYSSAFEESLTHGLQWDYTSKSPWYFYEENIKSYQVWFETDSSLGLKYDLADEYNLKGVGMWALGYDRGRDELWNELRKRYSTTSIENQNISSGDNIIEIFPNPVSDYGNIRINLAEGSDYRLTLMNSIGQELAVLSDGKMESGSKKITFNSAGFKPGLYFVLLNSSKLKLSFKRYPLLVN